ncbi:hypothetical protein LTR56_009108 [Elasticomyces elasticus]|nr:hypothetical protein LTR56_009108 [Elasticomyces elasticus]KAK3660654.1 hypothetical protein LTR22_007901 [Elasticomyces elasticus]KAK4912484.1 hypothetical protein LTR49_019098 [Elasticomyces elasticus]KAK5766946.1 hypothetical protein LTS12_003022 [Elasticomyces elasticus]
MLLHWGTQFLENVLPEHLRKRIKEPRVDPHCEMAELPVPHFNGATGEIIARVSSDVITRVSRKKLRRFLTEGEDLEIEYGKTLRRVTVDSRGVSVQFDDGSQARGDMVIGADGSHSKVREYLVGVEAAKCEPIGLTMVNHAAGNYTPEQARILRAFHPIVQLSIHPTKQMGALLAALDIPDDNDPVTWKFQNYTSWWGPPFARDLEDPAVRLKHVKETMSQFPEPFRTGWLALGDDTILPIYPGQQWAPTDAWDNRDGRVTLAGDAAHSMLPHRGQGLNNAIKDASDLVDAIKLVVSGEQSLGDLITAYEEEMRPRGAKDVALSLEQAEKSRDWDRLMSSPIFQVGFSRS